MQCALNLLMRRRDMCAPSSKRIHTTRSMASGLQPYLVGWGERYRLHALLLAHCATHATMRNQCRRLGHSWQRHHLRSGGHISHCNWLHIISASQAVCGRYLCDSHCRCLILLLVVLPSDVLSTT
jgi:hypothetical protein